MAIAKYGDIIFVNHGLYKHFGIYINEDCVIHYDGKIDDFYLREMCVRETKMDRFLAGKDSFEVLKLKDTYYDNKSTVDRARAHLGEENFNLVFNNCEHFAMWCKTGRKNSNQVNSILALSILLLIYI